MSRLFCTYEQAIEFLFGRINYERVTGLAFSSDDLKLERMRQLLELIGAPHERHKVIHVAGTKGKGSTSAMAASILSAAGRKTGLFTSPHVSAFEERIQVDGVPPSPAHFVDLFNRLIEPIERMDHAQDGHGPTYFELATALAWLYFRDCKTEIAVLEVGLGGRLDATNVCDPCVCVITNISRDHTNVLGSSVAEIAREKAGIVKVGVPVISGVAPGPAEEVIEATCRRLGSPLYSLNREIVWRRATGIDSLQAAPRPETWPRIDISTPWGNCKGLSIPLRGEHQAQNASLAVAAVTLLRQQGQSVSDTAIANGLGSLRWPARVEVVATHPTVVVDVAHNWASTEALLRTIDQDFSDVARRILVFGASRDKDVPGMLRLLLPRFDSVILTQYQSNPRAMNADELAALVHATSRHACHIAGDPATAWRLASHLAAADDLICITGSVFIAAELRELILDVGTQARDQYAANDHAIP